MHRSTWRATSRIAAATLAATAAYGVSSAVAQTGTPAQATTPAATTPSQDITTTGGGIAANGTENQPNASTNQCFVRLFKPKAANVPTELTGDTDIVVQYRVRCSSPMSAFSVSFNRDISGIESEIPVTFFSGNGITPDQAFNCGGDTPGPGVNCVGTYKGGYNTVRGLVALSLTDVEAKAKTSFCALGIKAAFTSFHSEVSRDLFTNKVKTNKDGTSQIVNYASGPYRVTTPQCHKGAKAKAAKR